MGLDRCWNNDSWDESHIALMKADGAPSFTNTVVQGSTKVTTTWDDNNDKAKKRPSSFDVTLEGTANGKSVYSKKVTLNAENGWSFSWDELPTLASDGSKITYAMTSDSLPNGYTTTVAGDVENGFTVTHSLHESGENNENNNGKPEDNKPDNGGETDNGNTDNGNTDNGNTDNGNTDNGNTDNNAGGTADTPAQPSAAPAAKTAARVPNTGDATNDFAPLVLGIVATVSLVGALVKRMHS